MKSFLGMISKILEFLGMMVCIILLSVERWLGEVLVEFERNMVVEKGRNIYLFYFFD